MNPPDIDAGDIFKGGTLTTVVAVKNIRKLKYKLVITDKLLRIVAWILQCKINIVLMEESPLEI